MSEPPKKMLQTQSSAIPAKLECALDVSVTLQGIKKRFSLRANEINVDAVQDALALNLPNAIGETFSSDQVQLYCLGPDEWFIIAAPDFAHATLLRKISTPFSLVDISHRNVGFNVDGPNAVSIINSGCPLDLSMTAFPVGKATRTVFERAEMILYRKGASSFEVEVWRSFSPYLLRLFEKAATAL